MNNIEFKITTLINNLDSIISVAAQAGIASYQRMLNSQDDKLSSRQAEAYARLIADQEGLFLATNKTIKWSGKRILSYLEDKCLVPPAIHSGSAVNSKKYYSKADITLALLRMQTSKIKNNIETTTTL